MPQAEELHDALAALTLRSRRTIDRLLSAAGVSTARIRFLCYVSEKGTVRSVDFADAFGLAPRTVTEVIDNLERDGMLIRHPDPADRRAKLINLTDAGNVAVEEAKPLVQAFMNEVFAALSAQEQASLAALLHRLTAKIDDLAEKIVG